MFDFRPVDPGQDAVLLHDWFTRPYAQFWGMQQATVEDVAAEFHRIAGSPHHDAVLGLLDETPVFLCERYDPAHHELAAHYDVQPGDIGMHFLVAPADVPVPGFTTSVIRAVMDQLFADPAVSRVVVEPDVRNTKVHRLNGLVGFEVAGTVRLSDKEAALSFCTRERFEAAEAAR